MLACDRPDLFKAAILVGGNSGPQAQFDHRIAAYREHQAKGTLKEYHLGHLRHGVTQAWADTPTARYLMQGFVERGEALDAESLAQVFGALTVSDLTGRLPAYKSPTLIVNGEFDNALKGGTLTASLIAQAEHKIIPGAGHCCFLEDPATFATLVQDFLAPQSSLAGLRPAMKLIAYLIDGHQMDIRPAPVEREWMDATGERFAYRCLPLNIANAHGWEILCPSSFTRGVERQ